jgi:hypothetical protein
MPPSTPGALRVDPLLHSLDVDVCDAFISALIDLRVRGQENFANNLLYSSEERLARALSSIAQSHKDAQAWPQVTQQELANMIGVTRQGGRSFGRVQRIRVVVHCAERLGAGDLLRTAPA